MQSVFRYPGGKARKSVREKILKFKPNDVSCYLEPFVGGGGIFFGIDKEDVKFRWINDLDENLIQVYLSLRDRPEEFIRLCREIEPTKEGEEKTSAKGGKSLYNARLKRKFDELLNDDASDQALKYFFVNRTVWGGRVNYNQISRLYFSNDGGWNIVKKTTLEEAADHLCGVRITSDDFSAMFEDEDIENAWIYCDPPYYVNTNFSDKSKLYLKNFEIKDHIRLRDFVLLTKHKVCLSYDDDEFIRELYSDFNIHEEEWTYCGTSSAKYQSKKKKKGKELIITNY